MTPHARLARKSRPIIAGAAYWACIFALGFALGTIRVMWLEPRVGASVASFIELPLILTASWLAARWLVRRYAVAGMGAAFSMGAIAFALLMLAELALATSLFGMSVADWTHAISRPPGLYGLLGQIAFALFPAGAVWRASP